MSLTQPELRLLGCLLEKERTTPDDYPLTANSLMRAANQSTSRDPVVAYELSLVEPTMSAMKEAGLVRFVYSQSNRATKFRQVADEAWGVDQREAAVLCLLMLRGPQTAGELKTRSERLARFADPHDVTSVLDALAARDPALVRLLDRRPGQKEPRWRHLLGDPSDESAEDDERSGVAPGDARRAEPVAGPTAGLGERVAVLEAEVAEHRVQVAELRSQMAELRSALGLDDR